jgi:hypothetical protein
MQERRAVFRDIALPEHDDDGEDGASMNSSSTTNTNTTKHSNIIVGGGGAQSSTPTGPVSVPESSASIDVCLSRSRSSSSDEEDSRWTKIGVAPRGSVLPNWILEEEKIAEDEDEDEERESLAESLLLSIQEQQQQQQGQEADTPTGSQLKDTFEEDKPGEEKVDAHDRAARDDYGSNPRDNAYYMMLFRRSIVMADLQEELIPLFTSVRYTIESMGKREGAIDEKFPLPARIPRPLSEQQQMALHLQKVVMKEMRIRLSSLYTNHHVIVESIGWKEDDKKSNHGGVSASASTAKKVRTAASPTAVVKDDISLSALNLPTAKLVETTIDVTATTAKGNGDATCNDDSLHLLDNEEIPTILSPPWTTPNSKILPHQLSASLASLQTNDTPALEEMRRSFSAFGIDLGIGISPEDDDDRSIQSKVSKYKYNIQPHNKANHRASEPSLGDNGRSSKMNSLRRTFPALDSFLGGNDNIGGGQDDERSVWTEYTSEQLLETLVVAKKAQSSLPSAVSSSSQHPAKSTTATRTANERSFQNQIQKSFVAFEAFVGAKQRSWDYEEEITVVDEETVIEEIVVEDEQTVWTEYTTEKPAKIQQGLLPSKITPTHQAASAKQLGLDQLGQTKDNNSLIVDKTPELEDRKKSGKASGKSSRKSSMSSKGSVQKTSLKNFLTVDAILGAKQKKGENDDEITILTEHTDAESVHLAKMVLPKEADEGDSKSKEKKKAKKDWQSRRVSKKKGNSEDQSINSNDRKINADAAVRNENNPELNEKTQAPNHATKNGESFQEQMRKSFMAFDALLGVKPAVEEEEVIVDEQSTWTDYTTEESVHFGKPPQEGVTTRLLGQYESSKVTKANNQDSLQQKYLTKSDSTETTSATTTNTDKSANIQVPPMENQMEQGQFIQPRTQQKEYQDDERHYYTSPATMTTSLMNSRMFSDAGLTIDHQEGPYITLVPDDDDMTQITFDQSMYHGAQSHVSEDEEAASTSGRGSRTSRASSSSKRVAEILRKDVWSRDKVVVQAALEQLALEAAGGPEHRSSIARFGGLLAILRAMEVNSAHADVQIAACRALEKMALDSETQVAIGEVGGIPTLVGAMADHLAHKGVQQAACAALLNISRCCVEYVDSEIDPIPTDGVVHALTTAMKEHADQVEIQVKAFGALGNLCVNNEKRIQELAASGGLATMTLALQQQWEHNSEKHEAISTLAILLRCLAGNDQ